MSNDNETVQLPLVSNDGPPEESSVEDGLRAYSFQEFRDSSHSDSPVRSKDADVLRIEFAERHVTHGEVRSWTKGHLVSFDEPISSLVRIVIGGEAVAHGELIELEGRVSVRVTEVFDTVQEKAA